MNRQRGVSLSGLLVWVVIVVLAALLGMKVVPSVMDYYQVVQAMKSVAQDNSLKGATVAEVRRAFGKQREVGYFKGVTEADVEITKDGGDIVLAASYQDKLRLFGNVSLVIEYEASSAK